MGVVGIALELDAYRVGERVCTAAAERANALARGPHGEGMVANAHARARARVDAAAGDDAAVASEAVCVPRLEGAHINAILRVVRIDHHYIVDELRIVPAVAVVGNGEQEQQRTMSVYRICE